jgi:hypothetical protein
MILQGVSFMRGLSSVERTMMALCPVPLILYKKNEEKNVGLKPAAAR